MAFIYIIYSPHHDKYYIGQTSNFNQRLQEHNHSERNTYSSKYRPWVEAALFKVIEGKYSTTQLERLIKAQKSKKFIQTIVDANFEPVGKLAQLVRVPKLRG